MSVLDVGNRHSHVIAVKHDEVSLFADFERAERILLKKQSEALRATGIRKSRVIGVLERAIIRLRSLAYSRPRLARRARGPALQIEANELGQSKGEEATTGGSSNHLLAIHHVADGVGRDGAAQTDTP